MRTYDLEEIRGLVLGNSNAAYAFLEKELSIPFINLSVPSQDLYYEYQVFCKCIRRYSKLLRNLEYIIIDLYDYIEINEPLSAYLLNGSIVNNRYDSTIYENKIILENFIREIREWNPHMKIILTLIPRYITMERITEQILLSWKIEFLNIVKRFCDQYNLYFFNYKYKKEISENHIFYADIQHMNTIGGKALSAILDEDLKKLDISS